MIYKNFILFIFFSLPYVYADSFFTFKKEDFKDFEAAEEYAVECQKAAQEFAALDLTESNKILDQVIEHAQNNYSFQYNQDKFHLPTTFISKLKNNVVIEKAKDLPPGFYALFIASERKIKIAEKHSFSESELKMTADLFKSFYHELWHAYYSILLPVEGKIQFETEWDQLYALDSEKNPRATLNDVYEGEYSPEAFRFINTYSENICPGYFDRLNDSGMLGNEALGYYTENLLTTWEQLKKEYSKNNSDGMKDRLKEILIKNLKGEDLQAIYLSLLGIWNEEKISLSQKQIEWFDHFIFENQIQRIQLNFFNKP